MRFRGFTRTAAQAGRRNSKQTSRCTSSASGWGIQNELPESTTSKSERVTSSRPAAPVCRPVCRTCPQAAVTHRGPMKPHTQKRREMQIPRRLTCVQSTPGRIRTSNPRFRRPVFYPIELRVRLDQCDPTGSENLSNSICGSHSGVICVPATLSSAPYWARHRFDAFQKCASCKTGEHGEILIARLNERGWSVRRLQLLGSRQQCFHGGN